ncbi:hypothetical protein ACVILI_001894 [Mesorhizobium sp. USDA 4775]
MRSRSVHLYRVSHDGRGNWTVTRPGFPNERRHFPADDETTPPQAQEGIGESAGSPKSVSSALPSPVNTMTDREKYDADVRRSYPDLSR